MLIIQQILSKPKNYSKANTMNYIKEIDENMKIQNQDGTKISPRPCQLK